MHNSQTQDTATAVLAVIGVWTAFIRPFTKKAREERKARRAMRKWLYGSKGVKGISEDTKSAPELFLEMKEDVGKLKDDMEQVLEVVKRLDLKTTERTQTNASNKDEIITAIHRAL